MAFKMLLNNKIDKKRWDNDIIKSRKEKIKIDSLFSKIVKSVMNFPKHTCTEIYGAFQQTWFWLKCRFTGLWLHMSVERLSPKVGSIPAFHSVQPNISSLLKYFPYVYMHLSVLAHDQVAVCIATQESDWGHLSLCISLHVFIFWWWWWKLRHERWKN